MRHEIINGLRLVLLFFYMCFSIFDNYRAMRLPDEAVSIQFYTLGANAVWMFQVMLDICAEYLSPRYESSLHEDPVFGSKQRVIGGDLPERRKLSCYVFFMLGGFSVSVLLLVTNNLSFGKAWGIIGFILLIIDTLDSIFKVLEDMFYYCIARR